MTKNSKQYPISKIYIDKCVLFCDKAVAKIKN